MPPPYLPRQGLSFSFLVFHCFEVSGATTVDKRCRHSNIDLRRQASLTLAQGGRLDEWWIRLVWWDGMAVDGCCLSRAFPHEKAQWGRNFTGPEMEKGTSSVDTVSRVEAS